MGTESFGYIVDRFQYHEYFFDEFLVDNVWNIFCCSQERYTSGPTDRYVTTKTTANKLL